MVMFVLFVIVMVATPKEELGYDFPLDEGSNRLAAAMVALLLSLWGAVVSDKQMVLPCVLLFTTMILLFGVAAAFAAALMFAVARAMVSRNPELRDFILTPFKDEEEK